MEALSLYDINNKTMKEVIYAIFSIITALYVIGLGKSIFLALLAAIFWPIAIIFLAASGNLNAESLQVVLAFYGFPL